MSIINYRGPIGLDDHFSWLEPDYSDPPFDVLIAPQLPVFCSIIRNTQLYKGANDTMNTSRIPGPMCQIWRWQNVNDGTLVRTPSQPPSTTGLTESKKGFSANGSNANSNFGTHAKPTQTKIRVSP